MLELFSEISRDKQILKFITFFNEKNNTEWPSYFYT